MDRVTEIVFHENSSAYTYICDQRKALIDFVKLYTLLLGFLFTFTSFGEKLLASSSKSIHGILGIGLTIMTFAVGWVILDYWGYSVRRQLMAKKHSAVMRKLLLDQIVENGGPFVTSFLPEKPSLVADPTRSRIGPYVFAFLNLTILLVVLEFMPYLTSNENVIVAAPALLLAAVGLTYPNQCSRFYRGLIVSRRASSAEMEARMWNFLERSSKRWSKRQRAYESILYIGAALVVLSSILSISRPKLPMNVRFAVEWTSAFLLVILPFGLAILRSVLYYVRYRNLK